MLRVAGKQDWRTPKWLFDLLDEAYGPFTLDAAASDENHLCDTWFTENDNGLEKTWEDKTFCNPPWRDILPWVEKAACEGYTHGTSSVLVLPAIWMFTRSYNSYKSVFHTRILNPRIAFDGPAKSPNGGTILLLCMYDNELSRDNMPGDISFWDVSDAKAAAKATLRSDCPGRKLPKLSAL